MTPKTSGATSSSTRKGAKFNLPKKALGWIALALTSGIGIVYKAEIASLATAGYLEVRVPEGPPESPLVVEVRNAGSSIVDRRPYLSGKWSLQVPAGSYDVRVVSTPPLAENEQARSVNFVQVKRWRKSELILPLLTWGSRLQVSRVSSADRLLPVQFAVRSTNSGYLWIFSRAHYRDRDSHAIQVVPNEFEKTPPRVQASITLMVPSAQSQYTISPDPDASAEEVLAVLVPADDAASAIACAQQVFKELTPKAIVTRTSGCLLELVELTSAPPATMEQL